MSALQRDSQWSEVSVCVVGLGVAGYSCADALMQLGASVTIVDESPGDIHQERAEVLGSLGAVIRFGEAAELPLDSDLVVVSPGIRPSAPVLAPALARTIPIWGELELAWRLRRGPSDAPWLCVTGTNGKTTVTLMLESMLTASGARAVSAGNIGVPLVDVIMHDDVEVIAVEVGAPQLPFVTSMSPYSAACLNIADDHIDHFGSFEQYVSTKERIYRHTRNSAIYSVDDDVTRGMVERADVIEGCRAIGFTREFPTSEWSESWTTCWWTGPTSSSVEMQPSNWRALTMFGPRLLTTSPMRWPPRRLPGPTGCIRVRCGQAFVTSSRRRTE